jgi:N-acetylglucosamine-6-phosphate deacetylase
MPPSDHDISLDRFENLLDEIPRLKVMTISPHLEAAMEYHRIKALIKRGVVPALGHDRVANESEILGALSCSQDRMHITHLFNVCSFHHRYMQSCMKQTAVMTT